MLHLAWGHARRSGGQLPPAGQSSRRCREPPDRAAGGGGQGHFRCAAAAAAAGRRRRRAGDGQLRRVGGSLETGHHRGAEGVRIRGSPRVVECCDDTRSTKTLSANRVAVQESMRGMLGGGVVTGSGGGWV